MPATLFLVTGPVSSGKTDALRERFHSCAAQRADSCLWIAPSERTCEAVRRLLGSNSDGGSSLRVATFPELARRIVRSAEPNARPLPELHQRLLLDTILGELAKTRKLPAFEHVIDSRGFADSVFDFLTELKGQGIVPDLFAETIRQLSDIDRAKAEQVARIYDAYQTRFADRRLLDRQLTYARAAEVWSSSQSGPLARARAVFVDGFGDFTPPQLDLLSAMAGTADEIWITLLTDRDGDDSRRELFSRPLATIAKLRHLFTGKRVETVTDRERPPPEPNRPAGLARLERALFRDEVSLPGDDAEGLQIIEAPGLFGEVQLVARAIKAMLLDGASAGGMIVTARDLRPYAELVRELFAEYGIPTDLDASERLIRNPAVALLLRAVGLKDDGFPFAATTALLRNSYFRPTWPESSAAADMPSRAEMLLRLLAEPRGRDAFLDGARLWAAEPQAGLEDEAEEGSRRRRKHDLAKLCLPFLERFFAAWDDMPAGGDLATFVAWLRRFAADLGIAAEAERTDAAAWARLWEELDAWTEQESHVHGRPPTHDRAAVLKLMTTLAAGTATPLSTSSQAAVRVLPAEQARHLDCDHMYILGLGERSFPLIAGGPLFDEAERQSFRSFGLDVRCLSDRLPDEMLLFYQLVTRPRQRLTLSFPAVDDKGQS
ncbi:MAG TPA: hypothetical protein VH120_01545, partial [Gemmataceae bacterium]|nr:hypothetical protein [Gemmataceae bacterium]